MVSLIAANAYPADQINADPGTTAFSRFLAGTGSMLTWWGDVGSNAKTSDASVVGDVVRLLDQPGRQAGLQPRPAPGKRRELCPQHGLSRLGASM